MGQPILWVFPFLFVGCLSVSLQKDMPLDRDNDVLKAEVLKHIKPGMLIEDAKSEMETRLFDCDYGRDKSVGTSAADPEGVFCLICSRSTADRNIGVYVLFENGVVTDVLVRQKPHPQDDATIKAEIDKLALIGGPVDEAKRVMEKEFYRCSYGRDESTFASTSVSCGAFCLICSKCRNNREVTVTAMFEQGRVTGVRVRSRRTLVTEIRTKEE